MKSRKFQPVGVDALEERMVMTAFQMPFTLVTPPPSQVNPKFLILTKHTETQISYAITDAFNHFSSEYAKQLQRYNHLSVKPGADQTQLLGQFEIRINRALNRLSSELLGVSGKVPFGRVNLYPIYQNRILGSTGVTDTTSLINYPSLQERLAPLYGTDPKGVAAKEAIQATQTFVRSDIKNYINQGVTFGYFKLGRGAIYPQLS
ncbi:hypothetical protein P12x_001368 [Tundrisphaera lichenicola]|uniref:hypothetical protein n=1 Tax=Tundrisphaera lichenicola TaxID=2029860 RepID=UPI003EBDB58E